MFDKVSVHYPDKPSENVTFTQARAILKELKPPDGVAKCIREIKDELTVEVGDHKFELFPIHLQVS